MEASKLSFDIIKEIFNIGVGRAADMLSQMLNKHILLDVPNIRIVNLTKEFLNINEYFNKDIKGALMISSISFENDISGEASLIFPANKMRKVIDLCLGEESNHTENLNFNDIDFDVIKEIGNIILNSILGEIGNFLDMNLEYNLPNVRIFETIDFEKELKDNKEIHSILLSISFIIEDIEVSGAVIINLFSISLSKILGAVEGIERELYG